MVSSQGIHSVVDNPVATGVPDVHSMPDIAEDTVLHRVALCPEELLLSSIETADHHKYGISPEDEAEFVGDLRSRLRL